MKDVAKRANVSLMSVSRALRNERGISEATRARILEIATDLGYRPNPLVGALMANLRGVRSKESVETIAFITSHPTPDGWRVFPTFQRFFDGAQARAKHLGFRLQEFWVNANNMPGSRLSGVLRARGIRSAIICPLPLPSSPIDLHWDDLATAAIGYSLPNPLHRATNNQLHTMRIALDELMKRGYRRIGLAVPMSFEARVNYNWTAGFLQYQNQVPKRDRIPVLIPQKLTPEVVIKWMDRYRPDAVLGGIPPHWMNGCGISIPEEMGFVNLDYAPAMGDIAGVDQNAEAVGTAAIDLVVEQLYHNESGLPEIPKTIMIEGRWRDGSTVRYIENVHRERLAEEIFSPTLEPPLSSSAIPSLRKKSK